MLRTFFYFLVRPKWWFRTYPLDEGWDMRLAKVLDDGVKVKKIHQHRVEFVDGTQVWISNYPYAYGSNALSSNKGLCSRTTAVRLNFYINDKSNKV